MSFYLGRLSPEPGGLSLCVGFQRVFRADDVSCAPSAHVRVDREQHLADYTGADRIIGLAGLLQ